MSHEVKNLKKFSALSPKELDEAIDKAVAVGYRIADSYIWRGVVGGCLPNGKDIEDIVYDVLQGILSGKNNWVDEVNFETFLIQTVRGNLSNLCNKKENHSSASMGDLNEGLENSIPSTIKSPDIHLSEADEETIFLEIVDSLEGKTEEQKIVEAIFDGCLKRREIIEHSSLSSTEYDNALKRLRRFLSSEEWQKKLTLHHK